MFLKNYTSEVPVSQTLHRIEQVLIKCGVTGITKEYAGTEGRVIAVTFQVDAHGGKISIRLPADEQRALDAMWLDYVYDGKQTFYQALREQNFRGLLPERSGSAEPC